MIYKQRQPKVKYEKFSESDYFPFKHPKFGTMGVHAGQQPESVHGSINVPIHLSSTFAQKGIDQPYSKFFYSRVGNPTRDALQQCLHALEYGVGALTYASGCGATASLLHTLQLGDHIIACQDVYVGNQQYMRTYCQGSHGMQAQFIDMTEVQNVVKAIKKQTKIVWIETPSNPRFKLIDIEVVCKAVKAINPKIKIIVDNTFSTSYITSPLLLGADVSYHSLTKFGGGHSDIVMGALIFKDFQYFQTVFNCSYIIGAIPSAFDCYLALRGLKTLQIRIIHQTRNAYHIAHFLKDHQYIEEVLYPGLKTNKYYQVAKKQMRGFGAMIGLRLKGKKLNVSTFFKALKVFTIATSLGGPESLVNCPSFMSHGKMPADIQKSLGITQNLIRLSIGVEDLDDLIEDLDQALRVSQTTE